MCRTPMSISGAVLVSTMITASAWSQVVFVEHTITEFYDEPWSICAVDMDHDQDLDIVSSARLGNRIDWWENPLL